MSATQGFVEIPQVYKPQRYEWHVNGEVVVWAEPSRSGSERWGVYMHHRIFKALKIPNAGWPDRVTDTDIYGAAEWVKGLGALVEGWMQNEDRS